MSSRSALKEQIDEGRIIAAFAALEPSDSAEFLSLFHRTKQRHTAVVIRACLCLIGRENVSDAISDVIPWLSQQSYFPSLVEPDLMSLEDACRAAKLLQAADPRFFPKLSSLDERSRGDLLRALEVLEVFGGVDVLLSWIRPLTTSSDWHIRSKATKLICRIRPNRMLVERQIRSQDARIRANAIEALWYNTDPEILDVFRSVLQDPSHRVMANALVGLCLMKDHSAFEGLISLSTHSSHLFRAAAVWAYGFLGDARFIQPLQLLASDPSPALRQLAEEQLRKLRQKPAAES